MGSYPLRGRRESFDTSRREDTAQLQLELSADAEGSSDPGALVSSAFRGAAVQSRFPVLNTRPWSLPIVSNRGSALRVVVCPEPRLRRCVYFL